MTTAALTPSKNYIEDGVTLNFAAPFRYLAAGDLLVQRISASGVLSTLVLGVNYTATSGPTDAGGTVTLLSTVAGSTLRIRRVTARNQSTDYATNDRFPAESHEAALDRAMLIDQEQDVKIADTAARALLVPDGETADVLPASSTRAGKFLGFGPEGLPVALSGTGNDTALRTDLALPGGGGLVGLEAGGSIEQAITQVTPAMFLAVGTGLVDDTAALQAIISYCWNGGNIRSPIKLAANKTYLVSDDDGDGYCLLLPDGVPFTGSSALTSVIKTTTPDVTILRRYRTGTARQGTLSDFCLDGSNVAKCCLELFGSSYDDGRASIRCQNALRPVVIDGVQNFILRGCNVQYAGEWAFSILNGAGTIELDTCYVRCARYGHVLIDNDPSYEGYQLGAAGGSSALAYSSPSSITVRGGIYEDQHPTYVGQLKASIRINTGRRVLIYGNAVLAVRATSETIVDDGRFSASAAYVSGSSFAVTGTDVTAYFPVGRRVLLVASAASHYGMPYGTPVYLSASTFRVSGNRTAIFTAGTNIRLVRKNGGSVDATVSSSAFGTNTTVTVSAAVVPTDIVSAQVGFAYGVVSAAAYGTDTTVTLTMDAGWSVPATLSFVEIGRSDDGASSFWYSSSIGAVTGTHIRDVSLSLSEAGFANSALRSGSYNYIYDGITLSGASGDWFEVSQPGSVVRPFGSLTGGKLRTRHIRGLARGFQEISYFPNAQANSGTFEAPGHASAIAYSSASGGRWRWIDATGTWQTLGATPAATVTAPTGGATIDAQARTAINDLIARLQTQGIIQ